MPKQNISREKTLDSAVYKENHIIIIFYYQFVVSKYVNSIAFFIQNNHEK